MNLLVTQLNDIRKQNITLRNEHVSLKDRTHTLESGSTSTFPPLVVFQLRHELTERERCSMNLIFYGVPKFSSVDVATRISDKNILTFLLARLSISLPSDFKVTRLGKIVAGSMRLLKIIFYTKNTTDSVLLNYNSTKKNYPDLPASFKLVWDKTRLERESLRSCHGELDQHLTLEKLT